MKKSALLIMASLCLLSCDYIMKPRKADTTNEGEAKKVVLGNDKDENGCVASAGYRWSVLKDECIRPVDECIRLNSIDKLADENDIASVYVAIDEETDRAEIFMPGTTKSVLLKKENKNGAYSDAHWSLYANKKYKLSKDGQILYEGAEAIQQGQITGDYSEDGVTADIKDINAKKDTVPAPQPAP